MRKFGNFLMMLIVAGLISANLNSCSEETVPEPTVKLNVQKDGHKVVLTIVATDATSYAWDYGDGNVSTVSDNSHEYVYDFSGDYTVSVTVTNESGSATASEDVTIDPEPLEILTGTPDSHPNGKTWVLDSKFYAGKNGVGPITNDMPITQSFLMDNILEVMLGLGDEYDNEFTFKNDGSLIIDNINGVSLGGTYYSYAVAGTGPAPGFGGGSGLCGISYTPAASGTFELKKEDVNMDVIVEDPSNIEAGWTYGTISLSDQLVIEPTDYFGFLDSTKKVLVEEITSEYMHVIVFMHGVSEDGTKPSTAIHVTFIPKK